MAATSHSDKTPTTGSEFDTETDVSKGVRPVGLSIELIGTPPDNLDYGILVLCANKIVLDGRWEEHTRLQTDVLPLDLNDRRGQFLVSSQPITILLRAIGGKVVKVDPDPFLHPDNKAGGTIDLLPLLLGEEEIFTTVHLISITTGKFVGCQVSVHVTAPGVTEHTLVPLLVTMISAHCMPVTKEGTVYLSAIGLSGIRKPCPLEFGQSLSTPDAKKLVWASTSSCGYVANTGFSVSNEDKFIPPDLEPKDSEECFTFYWNALNRALVNVDELTDRLSSPFLVEVAGVPKLGKLEVRGRYMGWVDARALLEPGQLDVTVCARLLTYDETATNKIGALLSLPPMSAKTASARETNYIYDALGHAAYVVIRLDLTEALVPKSKFSALYEIIGFPPPEGPIMPVRTLDCYIKPDDPFVDARYVRKSAGALAVHKELSNLACRGPVPMNQGIKRVAANSLLMRVRTMLKNFPPGFCSYLDWQDIVTCQHAASRRAVTASFAPQPPPSRLSDRFAAARCRISGDERLVQKHIANNLKVAGRHPRSLIIKALRCLEERNDLDAKNYLLEALNTQIRNRYALWILGAQEYDKGTEESTVASAAFRIAVKGDYSDGTANAIAWAALHTFHHANDNEYSAHVAARKMNKYFSLAREWKQFLKTWIEASGEEEVFWNPSDIATNDPILLAAAFFLCLRCYKFSESLLQCVKKNCATSGRDLSKSERRPDIHYLRAASYVLRNQPERAMAITKKEIKNFGPHALLCQMNATCLSRIRGWDDECEEAFLLAERAGAKPTPSMLYQAALARFKTKPNLSLQRAARAHEMIPCGHTALLIGRIYERMAEYKLAQRWCAVAVKTEALLPDAWAMLSILAMYERHLDKARNMLRTAKQVGILSPDIEEDVNRISSIVQLDQLPESLVKNMFCVRERKEKKN